MASLDGSAVVAEDHARIEKDLVTTRARASTRRDDGRGGSGGGGSGRKKRSPRDVSLETPRARMRPSGLQSPKSPKASSLTEADLKLLADLRTFLPDAVQKCREEGCRRAQMGGWTEGKGWEYIEPPTVQDLVSVLQAPFAVMIEQGGDRAGSDSRIIPPDVPPEIENGDACRTFMNGKAAAFALMNPGFMQDMFGDSGPDKLHPNFCVWTHHLVRTLVRPCSGMIYYIRLPVEELSGKSPIEAHRITTDAMSASLRGVPSNFAWRAQGSKEPLEYDPSTLTGLEGKADAEIPRLIYQPYSCTLVDEGKAGDAIYMMRVYSFHGAECQCGGCEKLRRPKKSQSRDSLDTPTLGSRGSAGTSGKRAVSPYLGAGSASKGPISDASKGAIVLDRDFGHIALVQVLDQGAGYKYTTQNRRASPFGTPSKTSTPAGLTLSASSTAARGRGTKKKATPNKQSVADSPVVKSYGSEGLQGGKGKENKANYSSGPRPNIPRMAGQKNVNVGRILKSLSSTKVKTPGSKSKEPGAKCVRSMPCAVSSTKKALQYPACDTASPERHDGIVDEIPQSLSQSPQPLQPNAPFGDRFGEDEDIGGGAVEGGGEQVGSRDFSQLSQSEAVPQVSQMSEADDAWGDLSQDLPHSQSQDVIFSPPPLCAEGEGQPVDYNYTGLADDLPGVNALLVDHAEAAANFDG